MQAYFWRQIHHFPHLQLSMSKREALCQLRHLSGFLSFFLDSQYLASLSAFMAMRKFFSFPFCMPASSLLATYFIFCLCFNGRGPSVKCYASSNVRMGSLILSISQNIDEFACLSDDADIIFSMSASSLWLQIIFLFLPWGSRSEHEALCQLWRSNGFSHFEHFPKYEWVCLPRRQCRDYFQHVSKLT